MIIGETILIEIDSWIFILILIILMVLGLGDNRHVYSIALRQDRPYLCA
jgi:hypothetical protein